MTNLKYKIIFTLIVCIIIIIILSIFYFYKKKEKFETTATQYVGNNINTTLTYTMGEYWYWIVPPDVLQAKFTVIGGRGGNSDNNIDGSNGTSITATINVSEGEKYIIQVGQNGKIKEGANGMLPNFYLSEKDNIPIAFAHNDVGSLSHTPDVKIHAHKWLTGNIVPGGYLMGNNNLNRAKFKFEEYMIENGFTNTHFLDLDDNVFDISSFPIERIEGYMISRKLQQ